MYMYIKYESNYIRFIFLTCFINFKGFDFKRKSLLIYCNHFYGTYVQFWYFIKIYSILFCFKHYECRKNAVHIQVSYWQ